MKRGSILNKALCYSLVLSTLATGCGCAKKVKCNIDTEHVHEYVNLERGLKTYIESEYENINYLSRTDNFLPMNEELSIISKNGLFLVDNNYGYLNNVIASYNPTREAYVYDYVYGSYYGYNYGYNYTSGKYEYFYELHYGYHYDHVWKEISLDEYTSDLVRDINYKYKLYKINEDNSLSYKLVDSLDEADDGYIYFKLADFVQKIVGDSYFLEKENKLSR